MGHDEVLEKVTAVFRDVFDDDSIVITEDTTAADIEGWDSLTHVTLINDIEDAFNCKFSMKDVIGLQNVGGLLDVLERIS